MKQRLVYLVATGALCLLSFNSSGQCKSFAKNKCLPELSPFIHNGQLNNTTLLAGEKAELQLVFYQGQQYRLMVCAQPILGEVSYKLLDNNRKEVFNSKDHNNASFWDFAVGATQNFYLQVEVPPSDAAHGMVVNGCVSVIVGSKAVN